MTRSFLNLITTDGKQCRLAEFGFLAESPYFGDDAIIFTRDGSKYRFALDSGKITPTEAIAAVTEEHISPDKKHALRLEFASQVTDGRGYVHMILTDLSDNTEKVLARFMGSEKSIGPLPFSTDGKNILFFGYPEEDDI